MGMPIVVFTDSELKRIVPHWSEEFLTKYKSDANALFRNLGGNPDFGIEVQRGLTSRNKFNEIDDSTRYVLAERTDKFWKQSGNASQECMEYSTDSTIKRELNKLKRGVFRVKQEQKENDE